MMPHTREAPALAIIGIGCRFPGGATDPAAFWKLLCDGVDAIGDIPSDRFDVGDYYDADPTRPGRMAVRWGGYVDGIQQFDADFFGISPREAARVDPQDGRHQRVEALGLAGVDGARAAAVAEPEVAAARVDQPVVG